ncbi:MAG TPA: precorrin-2 C(20)-methyltransferase [Deferrisomatales bacterium]|nr:precorrin-2 C(20)-methyltransferase [Deferrisomatales bacterium]
MAQLGTLYGVGVGPGDPELLTLKALRVLREVDVVFTSAQARSGTSIAQEIAAPHLREGAEVIPLVFDHTFEGVESGAAHRENAAVVVEVLRRPATAAFLTLGDPMTYSTFTYLLSAIREILPDVPVGVVPGITSFAAAAAAAVEPLAEGDESLCIVSAAKGTDLLRRALGAADSVVVMKGFRQTEVLCELFESEGLGQQVILSARCSRPGETLVRGTTRIREFPRQYMSLLLARRKRGPHR